LQGATVANLSPALADEIGVSTMARGVVVMALRRGSPARRFGFKFGDVVKRINGAEIRNVGQLQRVLAKKVDRWRVEIGRGGKILSMSVDR